MKILTNGSKILVKATLDAGINFFSGYPITPAAKILETFACKSIENKDLVFLQSEDEIAAIHHAIGASVGGNKSMTATSGPGFSLMQEGLGLAYATSVPLTVVNVMRQGPSTGMPTKPSQGDLLQTQYGTHGDYKIIVFYPNSITEIYEYTIKAINASEESKSPVIILLDAILANLYETIDIPKDKPNLINHKLKFGTSNRHLSGLVTDKNGVPKTNNFNVYDKWLNKKLKHITKVANKYDFYEYNKNDNNKTLIISFGSLSRLIKNRGNYDTFRPITLFPISPKLKEISKKYSKILVLEMNKGQYSFALESFLKREIKTISILGNSLNPNDILEKINEKI